MIYRKTYADGKHPSVGGFSAVSCDAYILYSVSLPIAPNLPACEMPSVVEHFNALVKAWADTPEDVISVVILGFWSVRYWGYIA